jgi:hypothetical protein
MVVQLILPFQSPNIGSYDRRTPRRVCSRRVTREHSGPPFMIDWTEDEFATLHVVDVDGVDSVVHFVNSASKLLPVWREAE